MKLFLEAISKPKNETSSPRVTSSSKPLSRSSFFLKKKQQSNDNFRSKALLSLVEIDPGKECSNIFHHFSKSYDALQAGFEGVIFISFFLSFFF